MKSKLTDEDVMEMRRLFWRFSRGEITQAEMQQRVNEIADRQLCIICPVRPISEELACT